MRLETPVLYFHPTESEELSNLTVRAQFHGGWLSEYFPDAQAEAPGLAGRDFSIWAFDRFDEQFPDLDKPARWRRLGRAALRLACLDRAARGAGSQCAHQRRRGRTVLVLLRRRSH